jgi:hypothetical protein
MVGVSRGRIDNKQTTAGNTLYGRTRRKSIVGWAPHPCTTIDGKAGMAKDD